MLRTNRGATAQYNATIKQINYIDLGKFVGRNMTRVTRVNRMAAGMTGMGEGMEGMMGDYMGMMRGAASGPMGGEARWRRCEYVGRNVRDAHGGG